MSSLAQKLWDQLGAPLDLVDKGKYGPEKGFKWKFIDIPKDFAGSNDYSFWQKSKEKELQELFGQGLEGDHMCSPDDNYRCKICGKTLKWVVYGTSKIAQPYTIYYYDYNYLVVEKRKEDEIITFNYMEINHLLNQREFTLYTLCRMAGMGYCDFSVLYRQIPKLISNLKFTGDKFHPQFEFYGDFESANLKTMVIDQKAENCKIVLKSDSNSLGFAQWFYYGVKYWGDKPHKLKFTIVNQKKKNSLFRKGMKFYVGQLDSATGITWQQYSSDLQYKQSQFRRKRKEDEIEDGPQSEFFNQLVFDYTFNTSGERVLFSYYKPYTFTELIEFLEKTEAKLKQQNGASDEFSSKSRTSFITTDTTYYKKEIIGGTRLGLSILMIEITSPKKTKFSIAYDKRKIILILGRQHPFETASSMVCEGFINFLISDNPIANKLKNIYIFKIVPMVNPDGVAVGNSRTNLSGSDLNRCWENPSENLQPEVFYIKKYLQKLKEKKKDIFMLLDLHGTATKLNSFIVGCEQPFGLSSNQNWISNRLITKIMQESMPYFHYKKCKFNVKPKNSCTSRVVVWKELKAKYSFNFEFSMHGYKQNQYFQIQQYQKDERDKLKTMLQEGQIDYDQYADLTDQINIPSFYNISESYTARSNKSQFNETDHLTSRSVLSNFTNKYQKHTSRQNTHSEEREEQDSKNIPITQFKLEDFLNMGKDICENLLKFTLMTSMMQAEMEKNGQKDLDVSKVKKENEINAGNIEQVNTAQNKQSNDKNSSFSQKVNELDQSQTLKKDSSNKNQNNNSLNNSKNGISPPLLKKNSFQTKSQLKKKDSVRYSKITRQDSFQSPLKKKDSVNYSSPQTQAKEAEIPSIPLNNTKPTNNNANTSVPSIGMSKSNFFQKLQKKIQMTQQSSVESSDALDSANSLSNSLIHDNSDSQLTPSKQSKQNQYGFKLNLGNLSKDQGKEKSSENNQMNTTDISEIKQYQSNYSKQQYQEGNSPKLNKTDKSQSSQFSIEKEQSQPQGKKQSNQSILRLSNQASPLQLSISDVPSPKNKQSQLFGKLSAQSPGQSPLNNYFGLTNFNRSSTLSSTKAQTNLFNQNASKLKLVKKSKSKLTLFIKYVIGQALNIKNLFPDMRSFEWVDYFTFEEIEQNLGEKGIENTLISMMNKHMTVINEYDTDSDPEDDLIDPNSENKMYGDDLDDGDETERKNKIKEIFSKFGDKYKGKLKGLKIDDMQALLDGIQEFDEFGNLITKKQSKGNSDLDQSNIWLSFKKNRSKQDSPKTNRQDSDDSTLKNISGYSNSSKNNNLNNQNQSLLKSDEGSLHNKKYPNYTSSLLLPKLDVIRLKNPFLPSKKEVEQQYKTKNLVQILQFEMRERGKQKRTDTTLLNNNVMITSFDVQASCYEKEKKQDVELDPFLCMSGSNFFSPSKTVQDKHNNVSPLRGLNNKQLKSLQQTKSQSITIKDHAQKYLINNRSAQNFYKQQFNYSELISSNSTAQNFYPGQQQQQQQSNPNYRINSLSQQNFYSNQGVSLKKSRNESYQQRQKIQQQDIEQDGYQMKRCQTESDYETNIKSNNEFRITNSQFGPMVLPKNKQNLLTTTTTTTTNNLTNHRISKTKTLVIYQNRYQNNPYQLQELRDECKTIKKNNNFINNSNSKDDDLDNNNNNYSRDESKKTIISFYRKTITSKKNSQIIDTQSIDNKHM